MGGSGSGRWQSGADTHPCPHSGPAIAVMSDWQVELVEDNISEFHVVFKGPPESETPPPPPRPPPVPPLPARSHHLPASSCCLPLLTLARQQWQRSAARSRPNPRRRRRVAASLSRQARMRVACGGYMWSCQRPTLTSPRALASSTRSTTQTSTRWAGWGGAASGGEMLDS